MNFTFAVNSRRTLENDGKLRSIDRLTRSHTFDDTILFSRNVYERDRNRTKLEKYTWSPAKILSFRFKSQAIYRGYCNYRSRIAENIIFFPVRTCFLVLFRFRSIVKIIAHPVGRKLAHDEMKKKKKNPSAAGCIPINRIFSVRCTYKRVQRLSLIGWVSWTRTCCYKLIFLARNEFSLSTSLDYSRSTIWIWKLFHYAPSAERLTRGKHTFPHRVFPMIYFWTFLL